jgi:hypothetical protein
MYLKLITVIGELKFYHIYIYIRYKRVGYHNHGRGVGYQNRGILLFNSVGFFIGYSVVV